MKKSQIVVGGTYLARVSGKFVNVRVDAIREQFKPRASISSRDLQRGTYSRDVYDVTNLSTGRKLVFQSAAKFRGPAMASL